MRKRIRMQINTSLKVMVIYTRTNDISVCLIALLTSLCEIILSFLFRVKHTLILFSPMLVLQIPCKQNIIFLVSIWNSNNLLGKKSLIFLYFKMFCNLP